MQTLEQVKQKYLSEALARPAPAFGFKDKSTGTYRMLSQSQGLYPENCADAVTAKVAQKYVSGGKIQDEAPIQITDAPADFLNGEKEVFAFTTPALGDKNLCVEVLEDPLIGDLTVKFPKGSNFAVRLQPIDAGLYRSGIDGRYYAEADLPENDDEKVTAKYAKEVKAERNARISDTDKYAEIPDMTVKVAEDEPRRALTEDEREEVLAYRTALRDMPEAEGFPFIDFPTIPACIEIECQALINTRAQAKEFV